MATINIKLRGKGDKVNLCFRLRDGRNIDLLYTSPLSTDPSKWDSKKQSLKGTTTIGKTEFDKKIAETKELILNAYNSLSGELINNKTFNEAIKKLLNPEKYEEEEKVYTLFSWIEDFIKAAPNRKNKDTGQFLSPNNIQQYKATYKHLKGFAKKQHKKDFSFDEINQKFYDSFVSYLQGKKPDYDEDGFHKKDKDGIYMYIDPFTANSVGKHIRVLKLILNAAKEQEIGTEAKYTSFKVFTEEVDNIALDEKELNILKELDLSATPYLDRVRDWFLLLAWTGSRFSDLSKIGKEHIKDGYITFRQQKTGNKVVVPLHPVVRDILEKYEYNLPNEISNQRFNEYIKIVCRTAGFNDLCHIERTVGGHKTEVSYKKWEQVSSHTGRRSFCTNMYRKGLPTLTIMAISGHKTEKAFLKYIKISEAEHAKLMAEKWKELYQK